MPRSRKKPNTPRTEINEEHVAAAIDEVEKKTLSIRKAAAKYGLKPSTLDTRLAKLRENAAKHDHIPARAFTNKFTSFQVFTPAEETLLNEYVTECSKMHYGMTLVQVRKLAFEYAKAIGLRYPASWDHNQMAGKEWVYSFRQRNPNLRLRKPENTSAARSYGFNKSAVGEFYSNLQSVLVKYRFTADRIYNFDESGISTVLETPKILADKRQRQIGQLVSAERGELVTFGGIISASGNTIPPLFIFPRVHFKDHFMEGAPEGSLGVATRSGWVNGDIFVQVLQHIQKKTLCSTENPILLLVDNHESHVTVEAINFARNNGIVYMSFPPHTTHRLQPLDVGVFGPFKAKLKVAFNDWHVNNPGRTLSIYNIPGLAKRAYFESFTNKNIRSAFEKTGISPFNSLVFGDDDFAPVRVYNSNSGGQDQDQDVASRESPSLLDDITPEEISEYVTANEPPQSSNIQQINIAQQILGSEPRSSSSARDLLGLVSLREPEPRPLLAASEPSQSQSVAPQSSNIQEINVAQQILGSEPSSSSSARDLLGLVSLSEPEPRPSTSHGTFEAVKTPESVRPFPKINNKNKNKAKKGKMPGKSRIYTNTPEKTRLEELEKLKKLKKQELERKTKAKEMKRVLTVLSESKRNTKKTTTTKNTKKQNIVTKTKASKENARKPKKSTDDTDTDVEEKMSLRDSSCSPLNEESSEESDSEIAEAPVLSTDVTEGCFVLVKFQSKKSVTHYVGQVEIKHSPTDFKVKFLRKKPGTFKFVFPVTKDEGTVFLTDVVCVLKQSNSTVTARTADIYSFTKKLSFFNFQ